MDLAHLINTWLRPQSVQAPIVQPDTRIRDTIRYMESRGQKDPYSFFQPSGKQELGDALGAYQITEAKLKENAKRFLGKDITRDQFLKDPKLQDRFVDAEINFLQKAGYKTNSLFAAHRGGWSDMRTSAVQQMNQKYKDYMNQAYGYYNTLKK